MRPLVCRRNGLLTNRSVWRFPNTDFMCSYSSPSASPLDLDLDLEQLWAEFSDVPTPPPCLAADHGNLFPMEPLNAPAYTNKEFFTPSLAECMFYPSHDSQHCFSWTGPDPLSFHTCADDIFLYISAFLIFEQIQWVEFRLCRLLTETGEVVEEYPFFLPRVESILGNLPRIRRQVCDIISRQESRGALGDSHFQLYMWPWKEPTSGLVRENSFSSVRSRSATSVSVLDPASFVRNIAGNFAV